jgi:hypothetical protein
MTRASRPYSVGYGKPPLHTRFQRGRSGNPSGRRGAPPATGADGPREEHEILLRVMAEATTVVSAGGRRRTATREEAMWRALAERAAEGDVRAIKLLREAHREALAAQEARRTRGVSIEEMQELTQAIMHQGVCRIELMPAPAEAEAETAPLEAAASDAPPERGPPPEAHTAAADLWREAAPPPLARTPPRMQRRPAPSSEPLIAERRLLKWPQ